MQTNKQQRLTGMQLNSNTDVINQVLEFNKYVKHSADLGIQPISVSRESVVSVLPYSENILGDVERGFVHTASLFSLADSACGIAVFAHLQENIRIATLDLRIDYLRPVAANHDIVAEARCIRCTLDIAFLECEIRSQDKLCAKAVATFMLIGRKKDSDKYAANG